MDVFGNGARVQVASTSGDLKRFGANSTGIVFAFFSDSLMQFFLL